MKVWYDQSGDYLEVIFEDVPATMEEIEEDMFERRTPDGSVVGFAVLDQREHLNRIIRFHTTIPG